MTQIQKHWLFVLGIFHAADFITNTFTNIFLWQETSSLLTIATYNLSIFITIPIVAILSCYLAQKINVKLVYNLAIFSYLIQCLTLIIFKTYIVNILVPFGIVSGLAIGFQSYAYNLITEEVTKEKREEFFGNHSALQNLLGLILPLLYSILVVKVTTYNSLFILALLLFILLGGTFYKFSVYRQQSIFLFKEILKIPGTNIDKIKIIWLKFLAGIQSGLTWSLTGIVLLSLLNNLIRWSLFTTILTFISILGCYFYSHKISIGYSKYFFTAAALLFAFSCLVLAVEFSLYSLILFLIVNTFMGIVMSVNYDAIINDLIEEDTQIEKLKEEYHALLEIPLAVGRILPLLVILMLGINDSQNFLLRIVFLIIAPIPLFMMNVFTQTKLGSTG